MSLSSMFAKTTVKNPFDPRCSSMLPFGFQWYLIHVCKAFSMVHKRMNLQMIAYVCMWSLCACRAGSFKTTLDMIVVLCLHGTFCALSFIPCSLSPSSLSVVLLFSLDLELSYFSSLFLCLTSKGPLSSSIGSLPLLATACL